MKLENLSRSFLSYLIKTRDNYDPIPGNVECPVKPKLLIELVLYDIVPVFWSGFLPRTNHLFAYLVYFKELEVASCILVNALLSLSVGLVVYSDLGYFVRDYFVVELAVDALKHCDFSWRQKLYNIKIDVCLFAK